MQNKTVKAPLIRVNVTKAIIAEGVQGDSGHCMIADALREAGWHRPIVDVRTVRVTDPETGERYIYLTPEAAAFKIIQFDQGIKPTPFQLTLGRTALIQVLPYRQREAKESTPTMKTVRRDNGGGSRKREKQVVVGGKEPLHGALTSATNQRQFGVRSLGNLKAVS